MTYNEAAALAAIDKMTSLKGLAAMVERGVTLNFPKVAQAARDRIDALKAASGYANNLSNRLHPVGSHVVKYFSTRGREWEVDVFKDGQFVTMRRSYGTTSARTAPSSST